MDPALWWRMDLRAALWQRDIGTVYRLILQATGMAQHRLAALVGQGQSEISEIIKGRQVRDVAVLDRIVERLGIPRELIRLSAYGPDGTYCGEDQAAKPRKMANSEMLRRHVLALGGVAAFGAPIERLGEPADRTSPAPVPLPERLDHFHVTQVRDVTRHLRQAGHTYGSDSALSSAAAERATRLLGVPGPEPVKQALRVAVAGLHAQGGWEAFEAGLYDQAMYHLGRALELATDPYYQTLALNYAGLASIEHGHPNDGLKMLQCGHITAWKVPPEFDPSTVVLGAGSRVALQACGLADSATALAALGEIEAAYRAFGQARELWTPTHQVGGGDLDFVAACLELDRGRLDLAEQFATGSLRRLEGSGSERNRTRSAIVLATIHVRAGESDALVLAHGAITTTTRLSSVRARRRLEPLAAALDARPGSDAKNLARTARQIATTRP